MSTESRPQLNPDTNRNWKRRTRKVFNVPGDIFNPDVIEMIKANGNKELTPVQALKDFGIEVDETQENVLNAALLQVDNSIFSHSDNRTTFQSEQIERFILATIDSWFQVFEIVKLPFAVRESIMKNPSLVIEQLKEEQRLERRRRSEKHWKK